MRGGVLEGEVFDSTIQISGIEEEVLVALDSSSKSSLIVEEKRYIEMHYMETGCKPSQPWALKLVAEQLKHVVAVRAAPRC